jgi:hypothetical protein
LARLSPDAERGSQVAGDDQHEIDKLKVTHACALFAR